MPQRDRVPLADVLRDYPGLWVAVDRRTNKPVLVEASPYVLAAKLKGEGIRNVAIVRAPDPSEPELVGLG